MSVLQISVVNTQTVCLSNKGFLVDVNKKSFEKKELKSPSLQMDATKSYTSTSSVFTRSPLLFYLLVRGLFELGVAMGSFFGALFGAIALLEVLGVSMAAFSTGPMMLLYIVVVIFLFFITADIGYCYAHRCGSALLSKTGVLRREDEALASNKCKIKDFFRKNDKKNNAKGLDDLLKDNVSREDLDKFIVFDTNLNDDYGHECKIELETMLDEFYELTLIKLSMTVDQQGYVLKAPESSMMRDVVFWLLACPIIGIIVNSLFVCFNMVLCSISEAVKKLNAFVCHPDLSLGERFLRLIIAIVSLVIITAMFMLAACIIIVMQSFFQLYDQLCVLGRCIGRLVGYNKFSYQAYRSALKTVIFNSDGNNKSLTDMNLVCLRRKWNIGRNFFVFRSEMKDECDRVR